VIPLSIHLNSPELFDAIIQGTAPHDTLPEGADLALIIKHGGTESGRAIAMLTFTVEVDGKMRRAQAVTSVKLLKACLKMLNGRYTDEGFPVDLSP
jgi:hypothetical protein